MQVPDTKVAEIVDGELYGTGDGRWTLEAVHAADEVVRAAPFDALERWWQPEPPPSA